MQFDNFGGFDEAAGAQKEEVTFKQQAEAIKSAPRRETEHQQIDQPGDLDEDGVQSIDENSDDQPDNKQ